MTRRGPKRKPGKRTGNGRLSKSAGEVIARLADAHDRQERETLAVALEARVRVFGLAPEKTRDQLAGSVIGRLVLTRELSRQQYDAAQSWLADLRAYRQAIAAPKGAGAIDLNAIRGNPTEIESLAWYRRSVERMMAARRVIYTEQAIHRGANMWAALDLIVDGDQMLPHLIGDLRVALNALSRHYGLPAD